VQDGLPIEDRKRGN